MAERRYAMIKLGSGDYLLPDNDAQTMWRIVRYTDGPSFGLEDWPRDRELWRLLVWTLGFESLADRWDEWDLWEAREEGFERRADAVERALTV